MPSEAENNLNAAELKVTCLAQVYSSTASWLPNADRGIKSPVSPVLSVLPACFALPLELTL